MFSKILYHQTDVSSHMFFFRFWLKIQQSGEKNKYLLIFCWQEQCASIMFQLKKLKILLHHTANK